MTSVLETISAQSQTALEETVETGTRVLVQKELFRISQTENLKDRSVELQDTLLTFEGTVTRPPTDRTNTYHIAPAKKIVPESAANPEYIVPAWDSYLPKKRGQAYSEFVRFSIQSV